MAVLGRTLQFFYLDHGPDRKIGRRGLGWPTLVLGFGHTRGLVALPYLLLELLRAVRNQPTSCTLGDRQLDLPAAMRTLVRLSRMSAKTDIS